MTLGEFKTYVRLDLNRTDKDTEIVQAYNDMVLFIAAQQPIGNYKYQSFVHTIPEQEDYPLPTDAMHLIHPVRFLEGTGTNDSGYNLSRVTKDEYDEMEPNPNRTDPGTGKPRWYTVFSRSILVTPIPDSAVYMLEINWSKRPIDASSDSDTSLLSTEWREILKWGVLDRVYAGMQLYNESAFWKSHYLNGEGEPTGLFRRLLINEQDQEGRSIGNVKNNEL
jgi:hypothetical protein